MEGEAISTTAILAAAAGQFCVQHPKVPATQQCQMCGAYVCTTCDFALPGGAHLCPTCATKPRTELSPRRSKSRVWSFALAIWATVALATVMSGVFRSYVRTREDVSALGTLMMVGILVPAIVGMAMGYGAIDRRLANPPSLWIATIWNIVIVAAFLLLVLIGLTK